MPAKRCKKNGKSGWKWNDDGKCFTGSGAREKAIKAGKDLNSGTTGKKGKYGRR